MEPQIKILMAAVVRKSDAYYLADQQAFSVHFRPKALLKTGVKSVVLCGLLVAVQYVEEELNEEDEEDDDQVSTTSQPLKGDVENYNDFVLKVSVHFIKTISITTTQRTLETLTLRFTSARFAGKLMKNVSKSALRKSARYGSSWKAACLMLKTGARSNMLAHFAIFLVEEAHQIYRVIKAMMDAKKAKNEHERIASEDAIQLWNATRLNLIRCAASIVAGSMGAAVGTLIKPGKGTLYGALIGDSLAYMAV